MDAHTPSQGRVLGMEETAGQPAAAGSLSWLEGAPWRPKSPVGAYPALSVPTSDLKAGAPPEIPRPGLPCSSLPPPFPNFTVWDDLLFFKGFSSK